MSDGMPCGELAAWLDDLLHVDEIEDYPGALNGLQVEAARPVRSIGAATDACLATIDRALAAGSDLLIVHHGLFWGGPERLVGPAYRRFRRLFEGGLGVYAAHLPLDAHPELGNNALLADALGVEDRVGFGSYKQLEGLGVLGSVDVELPALLARVGELCGEEPRLIPGGSSRVRRLAIVTGGGGSMVAEAARAGADTFLTGEGNHHTYHEALELGINLVYAGHYATETFGVRALAERAALEFGLEHAFFDVPTGL